MSKYADAVETFRAVIADMRGAGMTDDEIGDVFTEALNPPLDPGEVRDMHLGI